MIQWLIIVLFSLWYLYGHFMARAQLDPTNTSNDFDSKLYTKANRGYICFDDEADFTRKDDTADKWFKQLTRVHAAVTNSRSPSDFRPVKVAIIDTGIYWQHPEFKKHIAEGALSKRRCEAFPKPHKPCDVTLTLDPCDDKHGHGTHAASVLLQTAPDIELYIARVADDTGNIIKDNDYEGIVEVYAILFKSAQSSRQSTGLSLNGKSK
jgi:subtilisin family serine protease